MQIRQDSESGVTVSEEPYIKEEREALKVMGYDVAATAEKALLFGLAEFISKAPIIKALLSAIPLLLYEPNCPVILGNPAL